MGIVLQIVTDDEGSVVEIPDDVTNVVNTETQSQTLGPGEVIAETVEVLAGVPGENGTSGTDGADGVDGIEVVHHGTNASVARPDVVVVYWIGTATPANALSWDFWLKENI